MYITLDLDTPMQDDEVEDTMSLLARLPATKTVACIGRFPASKDQLEQLLEKLS